MVREDILGGLQVALENGASLEGAMMSFYNAGYKKDEIEEAARILMQRSQPQIGVEPQPMSKQVRQMQMPAQKSFNLKMQTQKPQKSFNLKMQTQKPQFNQGKVVQKVSNYEQPSGRDVAIIVLTVILVILLGALAGIFFFKSEIISFFGNTVG